MFCPIHNFLREDRKLPLSLCKKYSDIPPPPEKSRTFSEVPFFRCLERDETSHSEAQKVGVRLKGVIGDKNPGCWSMSEVREFQHTRQGTQGRVLGAGGEARGCYLSRALSHMLPKFRTSRCLSECLGKHQRSDVDDELLQYGCHDLRKLCHTQMTTYTTRIHQNSPRRKRWTNSLRRSLGVLAKRKITGGIRTKDVISHQGIVHRLSATGMGEATARSVPPIAPPQVVPADPRLLASATIRCVYQASNAGSTKD